MKTDVLKTDVVETGVIKAVTIETKQGKAKEEHIKPTTTLEEDRHTESQREINRIWEFTQAAIAVVVTIGALVSSLYSINSEMLSNAFFLVIGFYFGRTNHQKVGGVQLGR